MAGSVKALAPAHPAAIFIDVRVDSSPELHELAVAKGVTTFPSFLIERGDIQLAFVSAETAEKNLMALIQEIERNLGEHDVLSYQVWRRHENKLSKRGDAQKSHNAGDDDDEEDEDEEGMLWTWDVEAAGEGLRIESLGMAVALPLINDEDFEDERPVRHQRLFAMQPSWLEVNPRRRFGSRLAMTASGATGGLSGSHSHQRLKLSSKLLFFQVSSIEKCP